MTPVGRPGEIAGIAAVGRVHVAPPRQGARLDERERDLVARAPFALVETQGRRKTIVPVAARPGELAVGTAVVIAHQPRPVGMRALQGVEQVAGA